MNTNKKLNVFNFIFLVFAFLVSGNLWALTRYEITTNEQSGLLTAGFIPLQNYRISGHLDIDQQLIKDVQLKIELLKDVYFNPVRIPVKAEILDCNTECLGFIDYEFGQIEFNGGIPVLGDEVTNTLIESLKGKPHLQLRLSGNCYPENDKNFKDRITEGETLICELLYDQSTIGQSSGPKFFLMGKKYPLLIIKLTSKI
ncbi:MAG: hypothetical protein MK008_03170 [Bdellovibrionales bacterium]|nr:hypothetical protein [Bdellovibrionales bacterium]